MIASQERQICVKLKQEWMGNAPGSIVKLPPRLADSLFQRDTGEIFEPEKPSQIKVKLQRRIGKSLN